LIDPILESLIFLVATVTMPSPMTRPIDAAFGPAKEGTIQYEFECWLLQEKITSEYRWAKGYPLVK